MHYQLKDVPDLGGVVLECDKVAGTIKVLPGARLTSDDPNFYRYMEQVASAFLNSYLLDRQRSIDSVNRLLIVIHAEHTADIYLDDFSMVSEILPKGPITKGQVVLLKDIANIEKITFPDISIVSTDKVVFCFRMGWRFGLYFDFTPRIRLGEAEPQVPVELLDVARMEILIGELYRYLAFYHVYKVLEAQKPFEDMVKDGWFPFIEIAAGEFKDLTMAYDANSDTDTLVRAVVDRFTPERITTIMDKWWARSVFSEKKVIIGAAINAYLQNTPDGFINCIKNLTTEIEGVMRKIYMADTGKGANVRSPQLIKHVIDKARAKSQSEFSLFLPSTFLDYLETVIFAGFNVETGDVQLSRHSSTHGVADAELYKKERALQLILVLDQLYYYL